MQIIRSVKKMQRVAREIAGSGRTIGLVPTMGYLHEGHLSLVRRAKKETDIVITTIFVNPAQFAPHEDLDRYPRDEKGDLRKIASAGGDIVFVPTASEMYPEGFQTYVSVEEIADWLEGAVRPGHFRGVATVVAKLFNVTRPDVAGFGMKDYQQGAVIKRMARDLGYPLKLIIAPTVRERDGLAMSSRNAYLRDPRHRREAVCLYYALRTAREMVRAGAAEPSKVRREMEAVIRATCPTGQVDYIAFTDLESLVPVRRIGKGTVCSLAVRLHGVRLIDNMKLA